MEPGGRGSVEEVATGWPRRSAPGFLTGEEFPENPCDTAPPGHGGARTWLPPRHRSRVADAGRQLAPTGGRCFFTIHSRPVQQHGTTDAGMRFRTDLSGAVGGSGPWGGA